MYVPTLAFANIGTNLDSHTLSRRSESGSDLIRHSADVALFPVSSYEVKSPNWEKKEPTEANISSATGALVLWLSFSGLRKAGETRSYWILDSPLARRSLKGMVERDTVKGSLWRPKARMSSLCTAQVTVFIREAEVSPANSMLYIKTM